MPQIAVIGNSGGWSSELLADYVADVTGNRLLVEMQHVCLDLSHGKVWYDGTDLTQLDAIIVKKIGPCYSPHLLDRLEILRFLEYVAYDPSPETIDIARKAQALFDLDFTSVDVVETPDGPMVFEVSAFGGFKGMEIARNMDGAKLYADYVLKRIAS
jgi:hypothetical protein